MKNHARLFAVLGILGGLALASCTTSGTAVQAAGPAPRLATGDDAGVGDVKITPPATPYTLDLAQALKAKTYSWELVKAGDTSYYQLKNVVYAAQAARYEWTTNNMMTGKPQNNSVVIESLNVFVPAAYVTGVDASGALVFGDKAVNGFTAATAPIVYENGNAGYLTGVAGDIRGFGDHSGYLRAGFVYVSVGSRGRDVAPSPASIIDIKAGIRYLRANKAVLPGSTDKLVSVGGSGAGAMSSLVGATGNLPDYFPALAAIGAAGITAKDGAYTSTINDDVFAAQLFFPIADIDNADLAYAWTRFDSSVNGSGPRGYQFTAYQKGLEQALANQFVVYLNGLNLADAQGKPLTLEGLRKGSYYDAILNEISKALNAYVKVEGWKTINTAGWGAAPVYPYASMTEAEWITAAYGDSASWLAKNADGTYRVTNLAGFLTGTKLVRNKDIPGFDDLKHTKEGNAFGTGPADDVHFSQSVYNVLVAKDADLAKLDGYDKSYLTAYQQATNKAVANQVYLYSAMQILANPNAHPTVAKFWRMRNGTADEHTSFSVNYNIGLTLQKYVPGVKVDYALVWNMTHGSDEGTTRGTFTDWVTSIAR
jgi:hypothetical protein